MWSDLSWQLSILSISDRCKAVLQKGERLILAIERRNTFVHLADIYDDVVDGVNTPAQGIARCAQTIVEAHESFHNMINY
jgi:hypothetical protein